MKELYETNEEFKSYVDRYAKHYQEGKSITVEEALEHDVVKQYALYLKNRG